MSSNGPFGFDPEEFDRVAREAGEGLRDALDGVSKFFNSSGARPGWATLFDEFTRQTRPRTEPETTGETGDGVWAIYTVDDDGGAHIEQVYPNELDALRANKSNTDPTRKVRFLPYGIAVSVLDANE
jgi:N-acetyl-anhydromuramyl-L-alanine amidase AmpD